MAGDALYQRRPCKPSVNCRRSRRSRCHSAGWRCAAGPAAILLAIGASAFAAQAAEDEGSAEVEIEGDVEELVVTAALGSLPGEDVSTTFGFHKSLLETPRSASTVSDEMMARFNIRDIDELIALAPGSFTQSFFGVAGSLDIRGTSGETYFRGMRRLDNPGNYPTPIGASDRVDIVRGPASPIHGPAKISGYLNFNPKSARIEETGEFIERSTGALGFDFGSWDQAILTAEVGGPGRLGTERFGYWLYAELERSGSYYRDTDTDQGLIQASFDADLSSRVEVQFGGMYHVYKGNQVGGWNRLTQQLIDDGTYVTGLPTPLDTNGDGRISHQEFDVDGDGFTDLTPFAAGLPAGTTAGFDPSGAPVCSIGDTPVFGCYPELLALVNPGLAKLRGDQVSVDPEDLVDNKVATLYFDVIFDGDAWQWRNQMFFESYDHLNEVAIGFSQFHDTWVFEDKLVFSRSAFFGGIQADIQLSPSVRLTDFHHADDYSNEYHSRRDLTGPGTALDRRLLATRIDDDYTEYYIGDYLDFGLAALLDANWGRFSLTAGARHDWIAIESRQPVEKLLLSSANNLCLDASCVATEGKDDVGGLSWTVSLSFATDIGLRPYVTVSEQATVIAGQGADISVANVQNGTAFDLSRLREFGVKGSFLDDSLYFALAFYEQERTDFSAQATVTNQASETTGTEFELRWAATERLLLTMTYTDIEVVNLNTLQAGGRFSYIGADDIPGIEPWVLYGGALIGDVLKPGRDGARRAGVPENIVSFTGTYDFGNGLAASGSVVRVDAVPSGFSASVKLPAYTLVNAGIVYETDRWTYSLTAKNLTDERYFRANFPNLFGSIIVLPELPRHFAARIAYRW